MRKRPPPFTLVLFSLIAAAALAIVLAGRGPTQTPPARTPQQVGIGKTRACITTAASARVLDRSAIVINATANAPVRVTEQATGPNGIATVTRSETVFARVRADEPVEVTRTAVARARACARGDSLTAARGTALRAAYSQALTAAHALAIRHAQESLANLIHSQAPAVLANAKSKAAARAHQLAQAAAASLAAQAQAEARRRAGA